MRLPLPPQPPGPFRREFWRSPLRGSWLTSFLGSLLLPLIVLCALTGFLSHLAYFPDLGENAIVGGPGGFDLYFFDWPTSPAWLYGLTQGIHVISGVMAIPLLLAKLWSAMPRLFEWPPLRSPAHMLDRLSLALLVGGSLFVFFTGIFNIQLWYPWGFGFVSAHYYGALVFIAGLVLHLVTRIPIALKAFKRNGVLRPLRAGRAETVPEPADELGLAPTNPAPATISRRGLIATVGAGSLGLGLMTAGQVIGGPLRPLALLTPRGPGSGSGPNDFQVNRSFAEAGIAAARTDADEWRLRLGDSELSRDELLAMEQRTETLPIACVEGFTTTQDWTGVPLSDLARLAGFDGPAEVFVESLEQGGSFSSVTLAASQVANPRSLLALQVNGADLSLDHGFPARIIVPAAPGVHCTKWVASLSFTAV